MIFRCSHRSNTHTLAHPHAYACMLVQKQTHGRTCTGIPKSPCISYRVLVNVLLEINTINCSNHFAFFLVCSAPFSSSQFMLMGWIFMRLAFNLCIDWYVSIGSGKIEYFRFSEMMREREAEEERAVGIRVG